MEESTASCLFCDGELGSAENITVTKGLQTIRDRSVTNGDDIAAKLENVTEIRVHSKCRKDYTRRACAAPLRKVDDIRPCTSLRSTVPFFDFKTHCMFCGLQDDIEIRKKHPERLPPVLLTSLSSNVQVMQIGQLSAQQ
jgi:hypothetical protein